LIYLLLSILFATSLFVIFKYFGIYKVDTFKAIIVNYLVAFVLGFSLTEKSIPFVEIPSQPWFLGALFLGALFVSIFFVMALTAQQNGVSVASVAGKMSVVIPIFFGVFLYDESLTYLKVIGIIVALVSVYLSSVKEVDSKVKGAGILFPILLFLGSGTIDTTLKYVQKYHVQEDEEAIFSGILFGIAAIFGIVILLIKSIKKPESFGIRNVIAGIALGVPNFFCIYFLMKALQIEIFESSIFFTINNVAIVVISTLVGVLLFKEEFSLKNKIGVALAIFGILLVAFA
jgi:drug/metabolite transporter (DMT)-like permease